MSPLFDCLRKSRIIVSVSWALSLSRLCEYEQTRGAELGGGAVKCMGASPGPRQRFWEAQGPPMWQVVTRPSLYAFASMVAQSLGFGSTQEESCFTKPKESSPEAKAVCLLCSL